MEKTKNNEELFTAIIGFIIVAMMFLAGSFLGYLETINC